MKQNKATKRTIHPLFYTYDELAAAHDITKQDVGNIVNVINQGKLERIRNSGGRTMVDANKFSELVADWKENKHREDVDLKPSTDEQTVPMKIAMEMCGRKSKDYRLYFERYAKGNKDRSPMYLTLDEFENMKADLILVDEQITIDEVTPNETPEAPKPLNVDEIIEALRTILAGR